MPKIGILGITENTPTIIRKLLPTEHYEIICWDHDDNTLTTTYPLKIAQNPFTVIAEADILIIARNDEGCYGLVSESIFALKPVILDNLQHFSVRELNDIYKLSIEAEIPVMPYIDPKLNKLVNYIHQIFPDGIRFLNGTIKGHPNGIKGAQPLFRIMLLITLLFKSNILSSHAEAFYCSQPNSPIYLYFTLSSGSAALFYEPSNEKEVFSIDIVGKNYTHFLDLLNLEKRIDNDTETNNYYAECISSILTNKHYPEPLLNVYDLKLLIQAYRQITNIVQERRERIEH